MATTQRLTRKRRRRRRNPPGNTVASGYGKAHKNERARLQPIIDAGLARCTQPVCIMPTRAIQPGSPWHLAHLPDRSGWYGPAHAACNLADAATKRVPFQPKYKTARPRSRLITSRSW
jgi:hypothetical protein